jgi:putative phosphoribosyl transferase
MKTFRDRAQAGRELGAALRTYEAEQPIVLALPSGGVPVGFEVARMLSAPLDVWVTRKVGVPWQPELGLGAVTEGGHVHLSDDIVGYVKLPDGALTAAIERERREVERRMKRYRGDAPRPMVRNRTVILVDDGIATGGTMRAAIAAIKAEGSRKLIVGVPVASPETVEGLATEVDGIVCLSMPEHMRAVGLWYDDFRQVSQHEVVRLLALGRHPPPVAEHRVT